MISTSVNLITMHTTIHVTIMSMEQEGDKMSAIGISESVFPVVYNTFNDCSSYYKNAPWGLLCG